MCLIVFFHSSFLVRRLWVKNVEPAEYYNSEVPILKVLGIDVCAQAIFDYVPIRELVRSERVCRRWQISVLEYMQSIYTVSLYDLFDNDLMQLAKHGSNDKTDSSCLHRSIQISANTYSVSFACKLIEKWGCSIVNVFTARQEQEYFELIAMKCANLKCIKFVGHKKRKGNFINQMFHIKQSEPQLYLILNQINKCKQLKKIGFKDIPHLTDQDMVMLLQNFDFDELEICNIPLVGNSLLSIKPNSLKSLHISCMWINFNLHNLVCIAKNMPDLKTLTLDNIEFRIFLHMHLILNELPKLENLSLCHYIYDGSEPAWNDQYRVEDLIESLSRLENLRQIFLRSNEAVDNEVLEALANCKNLRYIDISNDIPDSCGTFWRTRGLKALCFRPPPAVTTLCLGYIENVLYSDLLQCVRNIKMPIVQNLENDGYVEFTPEWLENASRFSMMGKYPLEVEVITRQSPTGEHYPNLKIVLSLAHHKP